MSMRKKTNKILIAILKELDLLHEENICILAMLTGRDINDDYFKKLRDIFLNIMKEAE